MSGQYRAIVLDPPWRYENTRGTQTRARRGRKGVTATGHYACMDNAEIAALPVAELAGRDCALYLWVTNPRIFGHVNRAWEHPTPIEMVEGWGFRYVTLLTWVKTGAPGMGFHFRGHTEHAIYAVRGAMGIPAARRESNVIVAPRRGHSEKPEAFFDLVERVIDPPYLELFARRQRLGWDTCGNECFNHVELGEVSRG